MGRRERQQRSYLENAAGRTKNDAKKSIMEKPTLLAPPASESVKYFVGIASICANSANIVDRY